MGGGSGQWTDDDDDDDNAFELSLEDSEALLMAAEEAEKQLEEPPPLSNTITKAHTSTRPAAAAQPNPAILVDDSQLRETNATVKQAKPPTPVWYNSNPPQPVKTRRKVSNSVDRPPMAAQRNPKGQLTLFQAFSKCSSTEPLLSSTTAVKGSIAQAPARESVVSADSLWTTVGSTAVGDKPQAGASRPQKLSNSNKAHNFEDTVDALDVDIDVNIDLELSNIARLTPPAQHQRIPNLYRSPPKHRTLPVCHLMDRAAMATYIYPLHYKQPPRAYQQSAVSSCIRYNTLVALPTGLGKTFIAAVVMANYARWFPSSLVIFVAPTKPLVTQQINSCRGLLQAILDYGQKSPPAEGSCIVEMNGSMPLAKRKKEWSSAQFVFATPQIVDNDLRNPDVCSVHDARRVCLVVIDEAHRATGRYAYCEFVDKLVEIQTAASDGDDHHEIGQFRIVALTATPGSEIGVVQSIVDKLRISRIVLRTEESLDVAPYLHGRQTEVITVTMPPWMISARDALGRVIRRSLDILNQRYQALYKINDPSRVTSFQLRQAQSSWIQHCHASGQRQPNPSVFGEFGAAMLLSSIMQLLLQHGFRPAYRKWIELNDAVRNGRADISRAKKDCVGSRQWADCSRVWVALAKEIDQTLGEPLPPRAQVTSSYFASRDDTNGGSSNSSSSNNGVGSNTLRKTLSNVAINTTTNNNTTSKSQHGLKVMPLKLSSNSPAPCDSKTSAQAIRYGHPKLEKLVELVLTHFQKYAGNPSTTTRIIVFAQYRESVDEIVRVLSIHKPLLRCTPFIGQGNGRARVSSIMDGVPDMPGSGGRASRSRGRGRGRGNNRTGDWAGASASESPVRELKGQSQKEQLRILDGFRKGEFNILVATCVGEEGLDIGEVDLIINFDAPSSPIRLLQRVGRTGRARRGGVIILLTAGTQEENSYRQAQAKYRQIQKQIASGNKLMMRPELSHPMLPSDLGKGLPRALEVSISEEEIRVAEEKTTGQGTRKRKCTVGPDEKTSRKRAGWEKGLELGSAIAGGTASRHDALVAKYDFDPRCISGVSSHGVDQDTMCVEAEGDDEDLPSASDLIKVPKTATEEGRTCLYSANLNIKRLLSDPAPLHLSAWLPSKSRIPQTIRCERVVKLLTSIDSQSTSATGARSESHLLTTKRSPSADPKPPQAKTRKSATHEPWSRSAIQEFTFATDGLDQELIELAAKMGADLGLATPLADSMQGLEPAEASVAGDDGIWGDLGEPGVLGPLLINVEEPLAQGNLGLDGELGEIMSMDLNNLEPIVLSSDSEPPSTPLSRRKPSLLMAIDGGNSPGDLAATPLTSDASLNPPSKGYAGLSAGYCMLDGTRAPIDITSLPSSSPLPLVQSPGCVSLLDADGQQCAEIPGSPSPMPSPPGFDPAFAKPGTSKGNQAATISAHGKPPSRWAQFMPGSTVAAGPPVAVPKDLDSGHKPIPSSPSNQHDGRDGHADINLINRPEVVFNSPSINPVIHDDDDDDHMFSLARPFKRRTNAQVILTQETPPTAQKMAPIVIRTTTPRQDRNSLHYPQRISNSASSTPLISPLVRKSLADVSYSDSPISPLPPPLPAPQLATTPISKKGRGRKKRLKPQGLSKFIDAEVGVSDSDYAGSSDEDEEELDADLLDFIDDRSQPSQIVTPGSGRNGQQQQQQQPQGTPADIHNIYRQSLLSPAVSATQLRREVSEWNARRRWASKTPRAGSRCMDGNQEQPLPDLALSCLGPQAPSNDNSTGSYRTDSEYDSELADFIVDDEEIEDAGDLSNSSG
ncbi:3'-5' DNA helicase, partial [Spiromyces aspiralis]